MRQDGTLFSINHTLRIPQILVELFGETMNSEAEEILRQISCTKSWLNRRA